MCFDSYFKIISIKVKVLLLFFFPTLLESESVFVWSDLFVIVTFSFFPLQNKKFWNGVSVGKQADNGDAVFQFDC